ncbi:MAG: DUF4437 domain-containing protein [Proteobacteria bacterium]|nr:DUF4437 domain-containing protein [Pseudomonadota bacterium]
MSGLVSCVLLLLGGVSVAAETEETSVTVIRAENVTWDHLNPARGDKAPSAATLWGDRNGTGPTGFLLRPTDGFQSPPHLHNVSYRAVVIRGELHNDDPSAAELWMPPGSYWTQPKGHVHITSARGKDLLAYIEIDEGPYLVRPVDQAFATTEHPVNVHASNLVWIDASRLAPTTQVEAQVAFLWGNPQDAPPSGALVQIPPGSRATLSSSGAEFRAVTIQGQPRIDPEAKPLELGSSFSSAGEVTHQVQCTADEACILYVRHGGRLVIGN